jgi:hypothetical protein
MRTGFSIGASEISEEYSEAITVYSICMILHYYPNYTKEQVLELTQSQV